MWGVSGRSLGRLFGGVEESEELRVEADAPLPKITGTLLNVLLIVALFLMVVRPGDLVHADKHGAVVLPRGKAGEVIEAAALMARREAVVLDACRAPGADAAAIKQAMLDMAKVT